MVTALPATSIMHLTYLVSLPTNTNMAPRLQRRPQDRCKGFFRLDHSVPSAKTHSSMSKSFVGFLSIFSLLAGCAAPPQAARPQASAAQSAAAGTVNAAPTENNDDYETIFVPPPTGSLLGGGAVRVPKKNISGNDETALLGHIRRLNAAAGTREERPYVVAAISHATGVSERELQAQQDGLRLRFGELCAFNAIARGNGNKVKELASLKSKGKTWTELATSNGVGIATVVQTARNANEMTVNAYTNSAERAKGGQQKLKSIGVKIQPNVGPGN